MLVGFIFYALILFSGCVCRSHFGLFEYTSRTTLGSVFVFLDSLNILTECCHSCGHCLQNSWCGILDDNIM